LRVSTGRWPKKLRYIPTASSTAIQPMKKYVGTANTFPDSRTPLRFVPAISTTQTTDSHRLYGASAGNAEERAAMPAATETATVST
jgi:hypothetical protein